VNLLAIDRSRLTSLSVPQSVGVLCRHSIPHHKSSGHARRGFQIPHPYESRLPSVDFKVNSRDMADEHKSYQGSLPEEAQNARERAHTVRQGPFHPNERSENGTLERATDPKR
jgi:hypothetical protein